MKKNVENDKAWLTQMLPYFHPTELNGVPRRKREEIADKESSSIFRGKKLIQYFEIFKKVLRILGREKEK